MPDLEPATTVVAGIFKRYGPGSRWVLRDLDLTVEPGSFTVVVGANGSGKSTLMRLLAGVTRPTAGAVTGRPDEVGYVPERLPERIRMTGRTYLGHMARLRGLERTDARRRSEVLAESLGLHPGLDTPVTSLSKGNRQKVCLAQALLGPVGLLVLDEPWSGLDPSAEEGLRRELADARRSGTAVVATAHRVGAVAGAEETHVLVDGHLEAAVLPQAEQLDLVRVELVPPPGADGLPDWPGVASSRRSGEPHSGDQWELAVAPEDVDTLLRAALSAEWSVHRVEPEPVEPS